LALQNAITHLITKTYTGSYVGKTQYQDSIGGILHTAVNSGTTTETFLADNSTSSTYSINIGSGNPTIHAMYIIDTNLSEKYLFLSNRTTQGSLLPPFNITADRYQNTNLGPEAAMIYYYVADSIIYFSNSCPNLGPPVNQNMPYNSWYRWVTLK
jgi:hypothetical protein